MSTEPGAGHVGFSFGRKPEVLRRNRKPLKGGDTVYLQHQDYPIETVYERSLTQPAAQTLPPEPDARPRADLPTTEKQAHFDYTAFRRELTERLQEAA